MPRCHGPLQVMCTIALQGAVLGLREQLETVDLAFDAQFGTTAALLQDIVNGRQADVVLLTDEAIRQLAAHGAVISHTTVPLASSSIGFSLSPDVEQPQQVSEEDFARLLTTVPSIAFSRGGISGIHFADLLRRLGLADLVLAKAVILDTGLTGTLLLDGQVAMAVQQISELRGAGVEMITPLPSRYDKVTLFAGGAMAASASPVATGRFLHELTGRVFADLLAKAGLEPAAR